MEFLDKKWCFVPVCKQRDEANLEKLDEKSSFHASLKSAILSYFQFSFMGGTKLHVRQSVDFTDVGFLPDRSDGQSNQTARLPRDFHDVFVRGKHRCHHVYLHHGSARQLSFHNWPKFS